MRFVLNPHLSVYNHVSSSNCVVRNLSRVHATTNFGDMGSPIVCHHPQQTPGTRIYKFSKLLKLQNDGAGNPLLYYYFRKNVKVYLRAIFIQDNVYMLP